MVLKITNEPAEPIGLARFETFLDCGVLEITETDTALSLTEEGLHKLKEYKKTESLTAAIVQPGGSIRDDQVIATCNKYGIAMAFCGIRLFHH